MRCTELLAIAFAVAVPVLAYLVLVLRNRSRRGPDIPAIQDVETRLDRFRRDPDGMTFAELMRPVRGGYTLLHMAAVKNEIQLARLLLAKGAVIDAGKQQGKTPLHGAIIEEHLEMARFLLEKGADVNAEFVFSFSPWFLRTEKMSPLFMALTMNCHELARLLIEKGADIMRHEAGWSAMHVAASRGLTDVVMDLLAKEVDIRAVCNGKTALDLARAQGQNAVIELLRTHGT